MHLFVYGTLRQSALPPRHDLPRLGGFVGLATLPGKLYDLGTYPAAVLSVDPEDRVRGELYFLADPAATLALLDRYEGCDADAPRPHEYVRLAVDVHLETGDRASVTAEVYLYNRPVDLLARITSGDWVAHSTGGPADDPGKRTPPADSRGA